MQTARILLVRHGQSSWNALGRWQGQADVELTDLGRAQAAAAAKALGPVDAVISSDLARAAATAEIIAAELGVGPVHLDPDLRERHAGEWEGLTRHEIHRLWPGYLADDPAFMASGAGQAAIEQAPAAPPAERRPPGWEPDSAVVERALRALLRLAKAVAGGEAVAVTHGGLISSLERHLGEDAGRLSNLGGRWIEIGPGGPRLGKRVGLLEAAPVQATTPDVP